MTIITPDIFQVSLWSKARRWSRMWWSSTFPSKQLSGKSLADDVDHRDTDDDDHTNNAWYIYADVSVLLDDACDDNYAQAGADRASFVGCWFLVDECQSADISAAVKITLGLHLTSWSTPESLQALVCHTRARTGARHSEAREQVKKQTSLMILRHC